MKKIVFILVVSLISMNGMAQVFKTGKVLNSGDFSFAITPVYYTDAENFATFFHAGFGLGNNLDIAAHYGLRDGRDLLGADLELNIIDESNFSFSVSAGGHLYFAHPDNYDDIPGLDATALVTYTFNQNGFEIYGGVDNDIDFVKDHSTEDPDDRTTRSRFWLPVGFNYNITNNIELGAEVNVDINDEAFFFLGAGIIFYVK